MDGVEADDGVTVLERDVDDYKVVDVIEVFADPFCGDVWMNASDDQVAGCSVADLGRDMSGKGELTFVPCEFNLQDPDQFWRRKVRYFPLTRLP